jgi:hypothetical protein
MGIFSLYFGIIYFTTVCFSAAIFDTIYVTVQHPPTRDAGHPTRDAGHPTRDAGHPTRDAGHPTRDAGHPESGVRIVTDIYGLKACMAEVPEGWQETGPDAAFAWIIYRKAGGIMNGYNNGDKRSQGKERGA